MESFNLIIEPFFLFAALAGRSLLELSSRRQSIRRIPRKITTQACLFGNFAIIFGDLDFRFESNSFLIQVNA